LGRALQIISGKCTSPGETFTSLTPVKDDTFTIQSAVVGTPIKLLGAWAWAHAPGRLRIRSPRLHDEVEGLRYALRTFRADVLVPDYFYESLYPGDTLKVEMTGTSEANKIELASLLIYYEQLPGIDSKFVSPEDVKKRAKHLYTVETTLTLSQDGNWSGTKLLTQDFDTMKAGEQYALIGYLVNQGVCSIGYKSTETGNLRVGGPGDPELRDLTRNWFVYLSEKFNLPLIPVLSADNRKNIQIEALTNEMGGTVTVTSILVNLS